MSLSEVSIKSVFPLFFIACVLGLATADPVRGNTVSGTVLNESTWRNDTPRGSDPLTWTSAPHWHVDEASGTIIPGNGKVKVALYQESTDIDYHFPVANDLLVAVSTDLSTLVGTEWLFSLGGQLAPGDYRVLAWVDGNGDGYYDVGEPHGTATVRMVAGASGSSPVVDVQVIITEDVDGDGLEDWWEMRWFGNLDQTGSMDYDNDGLSNLEEYNLILAGDYVRPDHWDTDGDGMDDAWEVFYGLDPTDPGTGTVDNGANGDPDNDGITNRDEYVGPDGIGWREDANGDGIAEYTTSRDAMHPTEPDSDHDGIDDGDEFLVDLTHPIHAMSGLNVQPRSLGMNIAGGAGTGISDPTGRAFAFGSGGGTVELWIYPVADGDGTLYSFPSVGAGKSHVKISLADYRPKMELLTGTNVMATVGGVGADGSIQQLETNKWTHLAFVIAPDNKSISIYLNGVSLIAKSLLVNLNFEGTPTICRDFTDGYIDELRVWNYPRSAADIEYWATRYYPAPGYVQTAAETLSGRTAKMYSHSDPNPLMMYLRFDDGGDAVENFAYINHGLYPFVDSYRIAGPITGAVTTAQAVQMSGSDDADGDQMPEWWVDLYNMEKYQEYYTSAYGPEWVGCPDDSSLVLGFRYFRAFTAYGSVGARTSWRDADGVTFHTPKTQPDFYLGENSSYTKHVYLLTQPRTCPLSVYTPGMTRTVVYVNGEQVTSVASQTNTTQRYDVAQYMKVGRNTVHVECKSRTAKAGYSGNSIAGLPYGISDFQAYNPGFPELPFNCSEQPYQFDVADGKFDAELQCNGLPVIVRGDLTRADPRAVWHVQLWSTLFESASLVPLPDLEYRDARSNPDYGVPLHAERDNNPLDPDTADDGLDAVYEFVCGTNPRERDSNNNGVTDGDEDFERDGLVNREEQRYGSSPWLADSDDDGFYDGIDVGDGHPAQSLSPQRNQALRFSGSAGDYLTIPLQQRFVLEKWSIEAWIQPDATEMDGGIIAQRSVGGTAVNYELGIDASNRPYARYVSVAGVQVIATVTNAVIANGSTWTHLAATYYDRKLNLFVNGTNVASQSGSAFPALYAGGPVQQRIGAGFKGCIDEWRLWNVELTSERILANQQEVLTGLEADLVAYYRFDDGTSYNSGAPLVGTSANNGTNGALPSVAWQSGQVEDNVLRYASDWWLQWKYAATFVGSVSFATNHIMQGPPSLQVFIETDDAVAAGARWSHNGGASWNASGYVETHLAAGDYDITFNAIDGWITPVTVPVTLERGQSTVVTGAYVRTATLTVIIDNAANVKAAATWSIDGGATRQGSGQQVINLLPGAPGYDILFSDISATVPGWDRPATVNVQLAPGETRSVSFSYTAVKGALQVAFTPVNVPSSARWRVSGNTNWWASGVTVTNLAYGEHQVEYNSVTSWKAPVNETMVIGGSFLHTLSRDWEKLPEPSVIPVTVANQSAWENDESLVPPHWHVAPTNGVVAGQGRVLLALYGGSNLTTLVASAPLVVTNDLASITGLTWAYSLGSPSVPGIYRVQSWIDGNTNSMRDVGEPYGFTDVAITGTELVDNVTVTITEDADADGLEDWWEMHWFSNLAQTAGVDYDNDGLSNGEEYALIHGLHPDYLGTNRLVSPVDWDTDGDGMDDAWEVFYGLDPTGAAGVNGADGDPDSDGLINLYEYLGPDGTGWREDIDADGVADFTTSRDATDPSDPDTDDDGVNDWGEFNTDLTHPGHPMSSTNMLPRSLRMNVNGGAGGAMTDPTTNTFAFGNGGGTVELWIYPQADDTGTLYAFPGAVAGQDHFRLSLDNYRPKLEMLRGSTTNAVVGGTNAVAGVGSIQQLPTNQWTHLAFVIEPVNNTVAIYANGVLLIAQTTFIGSNLSGTPTICSGFTDGYIDELRVWNYPRTASDIEHWSTRYYPAPGYVRTSGLTPEGEPIQMYTHSDPHPLMLYLRFDDGGSSVENFAFLNTGLYPSVNRASYRIGGVIAAAVTTEQAVPMSGSDDADGDGVPEWWVELYNMEKYQDYYATGYGPLGASGNVVTGLYFRSFTAYGSIGNQTGWEDPSGVYYMPKTRVDHSLDYGFILGDKASYTKHVYLFAEPLAAPLNVYVPGMISTVVYVNGVRVTAAGGESTQVQQIDVAQHLKVGRNTVHVECSSTTASGVALGKFDAELSCNGQPVIVRGDKTRVDPRAVWHVQLWSNAGEFLPDLENRDARTNPDYGVPLHAERDNNPLNPDAADDGLDANYEYICGTNPRFRDSNNNGVSDGDEDFDHDGLVNGEEQQYGSSPWLADSDDDGILDGDDVDEGDPAQSGSPQRSQSLYLGGTAGDYLTMPAQQRFALDTWSLETWIRPDADEANGGILAQRSVGGAGVNYELGLNAANRPYVRYVSTAGVSVMATGSVAVARDGMTWTHVAATYANRRLNLYINGTNVASQTGVAFPAVTGGGPVVQRIGAGFKGHIDEWRLWNSELTVGRIRASLDGHLTGLESDLAAYYRFDDGTSYESPLVGTSANNGADGSLPVAAWRWGQVEDGVNRYAANWWQQWKHAASFNGNVDFSTNHVVNYPPNLQVFIAPEVAVSAGLRWSYNGGSSWNNSGLVVPGLAAGDYTIIFNTTNGWIAPTAIPVTLVRGESTVVTGTYVQAASLTVILDNTANVRAVATWSIPGVAVDQASGVQVNNLVPGAPGYSVVFSDISSTLPGWDRPASTNVQLVPGETRTVVTSYTPVKGALQISFTPTNAPAAARWRLASNTNNWFASGATVTNLAYGEHRVEYNTVAWWQAPTNETVFIGSSTLHSLSRDWVKLPEPTMITVAIDPALAANEGARWSLGGAWYTNSHSVVVGVGSYTVSYKPVNGWLTPANQTVSVGASSVQVTGVYYRVDVVATAGGTGMNGPWGVAITPRLVYAADSANHRIQVLDRVTGKWMFIGSQGTAAGQFRQPFGIAMAPNGDLWVADAGNHRIQHMSKATGVWTAFGSSGNGTGQFNAPYDVAVDAQGNVYVADYHNSRIQKRAVNGAWSVIIAGGNQNGRVRYPSGVTISPSGHLYVSDYDPTAGGYVGRVQKFNTSGGFLERSATSVAEEGGMNRNTGLAVMPNGTLLVANTAANAVIGKPVGGAWRDMIATGVVSSPRDVAADAWGNIVLTDSGNNRILILPAADSDRDGLPDAQETLNGTNPLLADTDGDGFKDGQEVLVFTDPLDGASAPLARNDLDGDGVSDFGCYDAAGIPGAVSPGQWFFMRSRLGFDGNTRFGYRGTVPLMGDFDGDGKADFGCYDASGIPGVVAQGSWYFMKSTVGFRTAQFGYHGTVPIVGDFDGDGKDDFGCYDAVGIPGAVPAGSWYLMMSRAGFKTYTFGYGGTVPVVGDFDGDGRTDFGCYDARGIPGLVPGGSWYLMMSRAGFKTYNFGYGGTVPVVGDFDGDGVDDFGCYDAIGIPGAVSPGQWYFMKSTDRFSTLGRFGHFGAVPVIGDFDGDGTDDLGYYNAAGLSGVSSPGTWSFLRTSMGPGSTQFGYGGTVPASGAPVR